MADRVIFSGLQLGLPEIAAHHQDLGSSLTLYFSAGSPSYQFRFAGYAAAEVTDELGERLNEADLTSSLAVLASVEAAFRIDYLQRCYRRGKDPVSRALRTIYKAKQHQASLRTKYSRPGLTILPGLVQSLANCVVRLDSVTGWRMDATERPNWDGATTLTTSLLSPI
jgi:hypothetical protein